MRNSFKQKKAISYYKHLTAAIPIIIPKQQNYVLFMSNLVDYITNQTMLDLIKEKNMTFYSIQYIINPS